MAEVFPFAGIHYSRRRIRSLGKVICPPYDIVSPELQQELYRRSPYNFVRIEFAHVSGEDETGNNRYARAAATLERWLEEGVLVADRQPAFYVHDHHFSYQGIRYTRRGLMARVRLQELDGGSIRPHEGTLSHAKSDRLSLLWACRANTSPIFALYEDKEGALYSLLDRKPARPLLASGGTQESHEVWAITEPGTVERICQLFSRKPLYIADGHHRYESALTYRRERLSCSPNATGDEPFNFVMMTLVDFADQGLVVLPPHRLVRGVAKPVLEGLRSSLESFFDITEVLLDSPEAWQKIDELMVEPQQTRIVLFGLDRERLLVLGLRDLVSADRMMPYFHGELYKRLDVSIIDHIILDKLMELGGDKQDTALNYCYDRQEAVSRVLDGEYQLAFLVRPVRAETIKAIADAGERMPKKSTYFYPKMPAGLMVYRL